MSAPFDAVPQDQPRLAVQLLNDDQRQGFEIALNLFQIEAEFLRGAVFPPESPAHVIAADKISEMATQFEGCLTG